MVLIMAETGGSGFTVRWFVVRIWRTLGFVVAISSRGSVAAIGVSFAALQVFWWVGKHEAGMPEATVVFWCRCGTLGRAATTWGRDCLVHSSVRMSVIEIRVAFTAS